MKYYGEVGYAETVEDPERPDVYVNGIKKVHYYGDVVQNPSSRWTQQGSKVNDDLTISNKISILADPYAMNNFQHIRYVEWMGQKWKVTNIEVAFPRLILTIGGEWNGETQETT